MRAEKRAPAIREGLFVAFTLLWSVVMTWTQLYGPSRYVGDYPAHLRLIDSLAHGKLEVPHFVFHALAAALGYVLPLRAAVIVVIALAQVGLGAIVYRRLARAWAERPGADWAPFLSATAILLSGPISVFTFPNLFLGYFVTATYHNPTIQTLKPLALLVFLWMVALMLEPRRDGTAPPSWRAWLAFGGTSLLMTLAKPSFSIIVPPALFLFLALHARSIDWRRFMLGAFVFAISIAAVLTWQYLFLYGSNPNQEGFAWAPLIVARGFEPSLARLAMKWVLSTVFPVSVLLLNWRAAIRDRALVFAWLCFAVSVVYYLVLVERGPRAFHGNFGWGILVTLFLLFFSSEQFLARSRARWSAPAWLIPQLALGAHFACGLVWYAASANWFGGHCFDGKGNWCW
ncbi:MAG TPA: hypothetical protein VFF06_28210 [Polyangia bacterium]|nr:hypothetical protein [Polyangia bacterium]